MMEQVNNFGTVWILWAAVLSPLMWTVGAEEICNLDSFRPTCSAGHVIQITHAKYGRMKLGGCLTRDYYVGCGVDVTDLLHELCSGKAQCEVKTPNTALVGRQKCPTDLVSHLEVDYSCLKVSDFSNITCKDNRRTIHISREGGFISGRPTGPLPGAAASSRPQGPTDCAMELIAPRGQRINITLYEFTSSPSMSESSPSGSAGSRSASRPQPGLTHGHYERTVFATIREYTERGLRENIVTASGTHRQELVYSSKTNRITIELRRPGTGADGATAGQDVISEDDEGVHRYLLQYKAIGCADPEINPDMTLNRRNEQLDVRCNHTGQVWHLVCRDDSWVGDFENCSAYHDTPNQGVDEDKGSGFPNGIIMAIIVGIVLGVMIGFCLLLVVYNVRRKRRKQGQTSRGGGTLERGVCPGQTMGLKSPKHLTMDPGGGCYGADEPMLPQVMNPDVTLDKGCHVICDVTGTLLTRGDRDHVYEKPQSGMEVQCLLGGRGLAGSGHTLKGPHHHPLGPPLPPPAPHEEDALMMKTFDSGGGGADPGGDYGCQFHTHKPWRIHGDTLEIVHHPGSKCALPT